MQGRHHSEETRKKLSEASKKRIGYRHSEKTKRKISNSNMGHAVSDSVKKRLSNFHTGLKASEGARKKMSASRLKYIKKLGNNFFIKFNYGHRTEYNGKTFRSSWEAKFAKVLDDLKIVWQYEPMLEIPYGLYFPDFYYLVWDRH